MSTEAGYLRLMEEQGVQPLKLVPDLAGGYRVLVRVCTPGCPEEEARAAFRRATARYYRVTAKVQKLRLRHEKLKLCSPVVPPSTEGGEVMVPIRDLAKEVGMSRQTLQDWVRRDLVRSEIVKRRRFVVRSDVLAVKARRDGPPVAQDGTVMVPAVLLQDELGLGRATIRHWWKRGHVRGVIPHVGRQRLYVVEMDVHRYIEDHPRKRGRR